MPRDDWSSIPARIPGGGGSSPTITLTSQSFNNGDAIGQQYYFNQNGCPGSNDNPELTWTFNDLPAGVRLLGTRYDALTPTPILSTGMSAVKISQASR